MSSVLIPPDGRVADLTLVSLQVLGDGEGTVLLNKLVLEFDLNKPLFRLIVVMKLVFGILFLIYIKSYL